MSIKAPTVEKGTIAVPTEVTLSEIETTHLIVDFVNNQGFLKQVYRDSNGNILRGRVLKVTGAKYDNFVSNTVIAKVQAVTDLDDTAPDGLDIVSVARSELIDSLQGAT